MAFLLAGRAVVSGRRGWELTEIRLCHQHDGKKSSATLRHTKGKVIPERFAKSWCRGNSSWQELIYLQRKNVKSGLSLGWGRVQGDLWISPLLRAATINTEPGLGFPFTRKGRWVISPDGAPECI